MASHFSIVVARLTTLNGVAIDDHQLHQSKLFDQIAIIKTVAIKGDAVVAIDLNSKDSYSINDLYVGCDGMVHVSRRSVGVILNGDFASFVTDITHIAIGN